MTDPTNVVPDVGADYQPMPSEVARLLRARTKDSTGTELGDWTEDTRPTAGEVADIIDQAVGDVLAQLGPLHMSPPDETPGGGPTWTLDELVAPAARTLVTLRAAMLVELSYFPEQVTSDRSAYEEYKRLYDEGMAALVGSGEDGGSGVLPGTRGGHFTMGLPSASVLFAYGDVDHWPEPENPANWQDPLQPPREPPAPGDLPVGDEPASGL